MVISTEFLTYFFLIFCGIYNAFLFLSFLWYSIGPKKRETKKSKRLSFPASTLPIITIIIPSLNEEKVIKNSIFKLLELPYSGHLEVLAADDNSTDETSEILNRLSKDEPRLHYLRRNKPRAQLGKGDVLNHAYEYLRYERFPDRDPENWIIGVFDADGRPMDEDFFLKVGKLFLDKKVAGAQAGVRIRNTSSLIAALQDVEFATFSFITQTVRDKSTGAVALGGNGQFIRASWLDRIKADGRYWNTSALTEDLDIGTRILLSGGVIRFVNEWVSQEGVESFRALFKQRVRWGWGALQVFSNYVLGGKIFRAPIPLRRKLDLHYYLSFWIVPFIVLASLLLFLLHQVDLITVANRFGLGLLLVNSFSFIPLIIAGLIGAKVSWRKIIYLAPLSIIYTYHWIPVLVIAGAKMITRTEPQWVKTLRYELPDLTEGYRIAKKKIGEILVDLGVSSSESIQEALRQQKTDRKGERLGEILQKSFGLNPQHLQQALNLQKEFEKEIEEKDWTSTKLNHTYQKPVKSSFGKSKILKSRLKVFQKFCKSEGNKVHLETLQDICKIHEAANIWLARWRNRRGKPSYSSKAIANKQNLVTDSFTRLPKWLERTIVSLRDRLDWNSLRISICLKAKGITDPNTGKPISEHTVSWILEKYGRTNKFIRTKAGSGNPEEKEYTERLAQIDFEDNLLQMGSGNISTTGEKLKSEN